MNQLFNPSTANKSAKSIFVVIELAIYVTFCLDEMHLSNNIELVYN